MYKVRLRRLDFVFANAPVYFVTACTDKRKPLLANDIIHQAFARYCHEGRSRGAFVGRYVLMPDHFHLFAAFSPEVPSLSDWIKSLKNSLSKTLNEMGTAAPHWQKGFFDHVLRSGESYGQKWKYVRLNPVRAGLVDRAEDWRFQGQICCLETSSEVGGGKPRR